MEKQEIRPKRNSLENHFLKINKDEANTKTLLPKIRAIDTLFGHYIKDVII